MFCCHFDIAHIHLQLFAEPDSPGAVRMGAQKRSWFNKCINHLNSFLAAAPPEEPQVGTSWRMALYLVKLLPAMSKLSLLMLCEG